MQTITFDTPDDTEVAIDPNEVVRLRAGREVETTVVELDDGQEVVIIGLELEVAAELGLNPLEYIDAEDDDGSDGDLVEDDEDDDA